MDSRFVAPGASPFFTGPYRATATPALAPPAPKIIPGDLRGTIDILRGALASGTLRPQQEISLRAMHDRMAGIDREMPPSIPIAAAAWLRAFTAKDAPQILVTGNELLNACLLAGEIPGEDELRAAMTLFSNKLMPYIQGIAPAGGATGEAPDDSMIQWVEPDPSMFYALDAKSGAELEGIIADIQNAHAYIDRGAPAPTRFLFVGKPGNGKTAGAKFLANALGRPLAIVLIGKAVSKWLGETGARLTAAADAAIARGAVMLWDEIDTVGARRDGESGDGADDHTAKAVGAMNQIADGAPPEFVIIGATNLPDAVDPAVARRLEERVTFEDPDRATREVMLSHYWRHAPAEAEAFDRLVQRTNGRSGDLLRRAAHKSNRLAVRRAGSQTAITPADVSKALDSMPPDRPLGAKKGVPESSLIIGA